mmetsp:Transcript_19928/g.48505  ORF Transcript_19928/g.48505 Transcript_19928/m.48505 type:complete len:856 (+) Transcript_19928:906-3473(+)
MHVAVRVIAVLVLQVLHVVPRELHPVPEHHLLHGSAPPADQVVQLVFEGAVQEAELPGAQLQLVQGLVHPLLEDEQSQDRLVRRLPGKIRVLQRIPRIRTRQPGRVRRELVHALFHGQEIALGFGHLLRVDHHVAVGEEAAGPELGLPLPDGRVVEQAHGQMVLDQVLPRASQIQRVPKLELLPHQLQVLRLDVALRHILRQAEDEVPHLVPGQILRLDSEGARLVAVGVPALDQVGHGVVGHVDSGVGQGLDQPALIPGQLGPQAEGAAAGPLSHPVDGGQQGVLGPPVVAVEVVLDVLPHGLRPLLIVVGQVPLIAEGHNALLPAPGHHPPLRLVVAAGQALGNQILLHQRLRLLHRLTLVVPHQHHPLREPLQVHHLLRLRQLVLVLVGLDLQLLHHHRGRGGAELRLGGDLDDVYDLAPLRITPLLLHPVLLPPVRPRLPVPQAGEIIRRVRRHGGHDPGTLGHGDRQHGQHVHGVVGGQRGRQRQPDEVLAHDCQQLLGLLVLAEVAGVLVAHVEGGPLRADEDLVVLHLEQPVLSFGQNKAVGLPIHGLRSERRGHQKHSLVPGLLLPLLRQRLHLHLDQCVLLRSHALPLGSVVISTGLAVTDCPHGGPLPELHVPPGLQLAELPPNELIIKRVQIRSDEGPPPINAAAEALQVQVPVGHEVPQPVHGVAELRDVLIRNAHGTQDIALSHTARLGDGLRLLPLKLTVHALVLALPLRRRRLRRRGVLRLVLLVHLLVLLVQLLRRGGDGHPSAVEAKGQEGFLPQHRLEPSGKLGLGEGVGVAQMQPAVHVGVGEGHQHLLLGLVRGIALVRPLLRPLLLDSLLNLTEMIALTSGHAGAWCGEGARSR